MGNSASKPESVVLNKSSSYLGSYFCWGLASISESNLKIHYFNKINKIPHIAKKYPSKYANILLSLSINFSIDQTPVFLFSRTTELFWPPFAKHLNPL